jgi:hypothetical protein
MICEVVHFARFCSVQQRTEFLPVLVSQRAAVADHVKNFDHRLADLARSERGLEFAGGQELLERLTIF